MGGEEEADAVKSVYGDDCLVIHQWPPRINLLIRPRTADISSEQFVQALISIRAGPNVLSHCFSSLIIIIIIIIVIFFLIFD